MGVRRRIEPRSLVYPCPGLWLSGATVRVLFIAMMVVGLIGFVTMLAYVLAH
jgi:hypothetical protein